MEIFVECTDVWDAVVTCFFIDTAHNIIEYIEIISRILKDGGVSSSVVMSLTTLVFVPPSYQFINPWLIEWQVWINLGPLLYHFADVYGQAVSFLSTSISFAHMLWGCVIHLLLKKKKKNVFIVLFQEMSVELSLEDVRRVALHYGFHFEVSLFQFRYVS